MSKITGIPTFIFDLLDPNTKAALFKLTGKTLDDAIKAINKSVKGVNKQADINKTELNKNANKIIGTSKTSKPSKTPKPANQNVKGAKPKDPKAGAGSGSSKSNTPTMVPKTKPNLQGLAKTPTNLGLLPIKVRRELRKASSVTQAEKILQKAGLSATLAGIVALSMSKFSNKNNKTSNLTDAQKRARAERSLIPNRKKLASETGLSTVSDEQRQEASKLAKKRKAPPVKKKIDTKNKDKKKLAGDELGPSAGSPKKPEPVVNNNKKPKSTTYTPSRAIKKSEPKESLKDQFFRQGVRKYGPFTVDSTDRGMSKYGDSENWKELEAEEEMNLRKGGTARRKAFGKGGMYKAPKKIYGARNGGFTRRFRG